MNQREGFHGKCFYCGNTYTKAGMSRHLKACQARKDANATEEGKAFRLLHIQAWGSYAPGFWLHLETAAKTTLADLDDFFRAIWMECCGHLSQFIIDDVYYSGSPSRDFGFSLGVEEKDIRTPLWKAARPGDEFQYEYDFGTTTPVKLKVMDEREGVPPEESINVMARNYLPNIPCEVCDQPAEHLLTWEYPPTPYCQEHAEEHDNWPDGFLPVVNSPRIGDCGYTGPRNDNYIFDEIYQNEEE